MSATELVCAAPSQQHYKLSNTRLQLVVFVASLLEVLLAAPREETRRHLEGGREMRAASAPLQQHQQQQATAVSSDDELSESMGALQSSLLKVPPDAA